MRMREIQYRLEKIHRLREQFADHDSDIQDIKRPKGWTKFNFTRKIKMLARHEKIAEHLLYDGIKKWAIRKGKM